MPYASKEANAAWQRMNRRERARAGRCIQCHRKRAPGHVYCLDCKFTHRFQIRRMLARRRALGLCIGCAKPAPRGYSTCIPCRKASGSVKPRKSA